MRARSGRADCALVTRAVYDAHPPDPARARGDVPRHGLSLLASSQKNWAWQIVAGRVRPHEKQIRRTARAPVARFGTSAARRTRLAADLCFRSARNARLAPACPDGRFDRMMTLFLRWRTSRTTAPACWPRLGGADRGSTDLNWVLMGAERVCRTFLRSVLDAHPVGRSTRLRRSSSVRVFVCV